MGLTEIRFFFPLPGLQSKRLVLADRHHDHRSNIARPPPHKRVRFGQRHRQFLRLPKLMPHCRRQTNALEIPFYVLWLNTTLSQHAFNSEITESADTPLDPMGQMQRLHKWH